MPNPLAAIPVTYRGTDVQEATPGIFLQIVRGLPWEPPEVRGKDTVVPSLAGRAIGSRKADRWTHLLEGFVQGNGATEADQRASFRVSAMALAALFDTTLPPGALVLTLPGAAPATYTIQARTLNVVWRRDVAGLFEAVNIELESVPSTGWVVT